MAACYGGRITCPPYDAMASASPTNALNSSDAESHMETSMRNTRIPYDDVKFPASMASEAMTVNPRVKLNQICHWMVNAAIEMAKDCPVIHEISVRPSKFRKQMSAASHIKREHGFVMSSVMFINTFAI